MPVPALPPHYEAPYSAAPPSNPLRLGVEYLRFGWRRMSPDAAQVLLELSDRNEIYIVTGRSVAGEPLIRRWLRRHGIDGKIAGIRMAPPGLRPAQHKLATALMLGIDAHIDDDPRTAYHLVEHGVPHVYLLDHAGAHGDTPLPRACASCAPSASSRKRSARWGKVAPSFISLTNICFRLRSRRLIGTTRQSTLFHV